MRDDKQEHILAYRVYADTDKEIVDSTDEREPEFIVCRGCLQHTDDREQLRADDFGPCEQHVCARCGAVIERPA